MTRDILAIDVGTTTFKMSVFTADLEKKCEVTRIYDVNLYRHGMADIEPEKWWNALSSCCMEIKHQLGNVSVVAISVTTPGLTPISCDGRALGPAILFFDGRSNAQAAVIRQKFGEERFLRETCNLPVSGGSSLSSILWIKENQPHVWAETRCFGHTNTYLAGRMTGRWAVDPSTVSITGMYNTAINDLTWNLEVLRLAEIPLEKLPTLMQSHNPVGEILPSVARELGLPMDTVVLCGGNDAILAALSSGLSQPGDISHVCGTCDITNVCVDTPIYSPDFNIRCHVIPRRWVTFKILNTGGKALEWFHKTFCQDISTEQFYAEYVPAVLDSFFGEPNIDEREAELPVYTPFLAGSRYSLERLKADFEGVTLETRREDVLIGLLRGNAAYHGRHIREIAEMVSLKKEMVISGGGAKIRGILHVKRRWVGDFEYQYRDQSSLFGAAILGQIYLSGKEFSDLYIS